jgi:type I restriction enzyme S subunit
MKNRRFDLVPLGSLLEASPQNGYSPVCPDAPTGKWVLGLAALNGRGLDLAGAKPAPVNEPLVDKFMLQPGDFLISRSNTLEKVGRIGVFQGGLDNCAYPDLMMRFRPDRKKVNPDYLETYLKSDSAVKFIRQHAAGSSGSMKKINQHTVKSIPIVLPQINEQVRIADILGAWYQATDKAEQLIAAKERLYTHELSRFISQYAKRHVLLADIAMVWKGQQLNKTNMVDDGQYHVLNGGILPSGRTTAWNVEENTITLSEGGNSCGYVNFNTDKFWCGGHCYALKRISNDVDAHYLFHFLKFHQNKLMALRVGSGLPNIQRNDVESFPVRLPDLAKQTAIARYLNVLQEEISMLGVYVEQLKTQKRGLMQKLLTGKWRLKVLQGGKND